GFQVLCAPRDIGALPLPARGTALIECLCHLTANEMFDAAGGWRDPAERLLSDLATLERRCAALIVVTNEVGAGTEEEYSEGTRRYVETLGRLNAALAARFDTVCEMVAGIPLVRKGALP
ncbi:MAG: bifunctional adenosylcobinamide kinase/adenosylcobinamide-phosphate guanylyltransferase, partial [Clostridia bacterium]|nr:bifunctional adenosylcobinamide kinase/adenosylcobinamide-phosphate guanylyltransferase [Clostridia bacterium]